MKQLQVEYDTARKEGDHHAMRNARKAWHELNAVKRRYNQTPSRMSTLTKPLDAKKAKRMERYNRKRKGVQQVGGYE